MNSTKIKSIVVCVFSLVLAQCVALAQDSGPGALTRPEIEAMRAQAQANLNQAMANVTSYNEQYNNLSMSLMQVKCMLARLYDERAAMAPPGYAQWQEELNNLTQERKTLSGNIGYEQIKAGIDQAIIDYNNEVIDAGSSLINDLEEFRQALYDAIDACNKILEGLPSPENPGSSQGYYPDANCPTGSGFGSYYENPQDVIDFYKDLLRKLYLKLGELNLMELHIQNTIMYLGMDNDALQEEIANFVADTSALAQINDGITTLNNNSQFVSAQSNLGPINDQINYYENEAININAAINNCNNTIEGYNATINELNAKIATYNSWLSTMP